MVQKQEKNQGGPVIQNKKAWFNFEVVEKVETGMLLVGTEVKSLRDKQCELDAAYARLMEGEIWLIGCKIAPYAQAAGFANHDPTRKRKLLLHKAQIKKLRGKLDQRGFTLVPLRIYFNSRGIAKCELGLARGKRQYDKRQKIQDKDQKRDMSRMKNFK
jgi:SsrA-binding protein